MFQFVFNNPVKVLFGPGQLQNLHKEKLPGRKALIATSNGTSTKRYGYLDALEKELDLAGVSYTVFDEVRPNPTDVNVMDFSASQKPAFSPGIADNIPQTAREQRGRGNSHGRDSNCLS